MIWVMYIKFYELRDQAQPTLRTEFNKIKEKWIFLSAEEEAVSQYC